MAVFSGNGSNTSPSFTFSSDTDTGLYRIGDNDLGIAANGGNIVSISQSRVNIGDKIYADLSAGVVGINTTNPNVLGGARFVVNDQTLTIIQGAERPTAHFSNTNDSYQATVRMPRLGMRFLQDFTPQAQYNGFNATGNIPRIPSGTEPGLTLGTTASDGDLANTFCITGGIHRTYLEYTGDIAIGGTHDISMNDTNTHGQGFFFVHVAARSSTNSYAMGYIITGGGTPPNVNVTGLESVGIVLSSPGAGTFRFTNNTGVLQRFLVTFTRLA